MYNVYSNLTERAIKMANFHSLLVQMLWSLAHSLIVLFQLLLNSFLSVFRADKPVTSFVDLLSESE